MRILPKVTVVKKEYFRLTKKNPWKISNNVMGLYSRNVIWIRKRIFMTILHELIHWVLEKPKEHDSYISLLLFFDFLTKTHDFVNGVLRYPLWRKHVHKALKEVIMEFNDWLDWMFCRNGWKEK